MENKTNVQQGNVLASIVLICVILQKCKNFKPVQSCNLLLTTVSGSFGINNLYTEQSYWQQLSRIIFKNNITYKNEHLLSRIKGGYIIISNHIHVSDIPLIRSKIDCYTIAKSDLISKEYTTLNKLSETLFDNLKLIPYKRGCIESGNLIKQRIIAITKNGENVLVFPEGTSQLNCHNGIKQFKKGLFHTAKQYDIPILPIAIYYTNSNYGFQAGAKFTITSLLNETNVIVKFMHPRFPKHYDNVTNLTESVYNAINNSVLKMHRKVIATNNSSTCAQDRT